MNTIIVIKETYEINKLIRFIEKNTLILCLNLEVFYKLKSYNQFKLRLITDYETSEDYLIDWIKKWSNKKIINGKNIKEYLSIKDFSFWWLMEYWIYNSYSYFDSWKRVLKTFSTLNQIINYEKPKKIILFNDEDIYVRSLSILCQKYELELIKIKTYKRLQFLLVNKLKINIIKAYLLISYLGRKIVWNISKTIFKIKSKNLKNRIAFISFAPSWKYDKDKYIDPIIKRMGVNEQNIVYLDTPFAQFFGVIKLFIKSKKKKNIVAIEEYLNKSASKKSKKLHNELIIKYKLLKKNKYFINSFIYEDANIYSLLEPQLSCYFKIRLKWHVFNFLSAHNFIINLKPRLIVDPQETGEFDKCLFYWGRKYNVSTLAIQHGIMNDLRCIHNKDDIQDDNLNYPLPTLTAVYGKSDQQFLIKKGNYPPKSVVVTGNQRNDCLANAKQIFNKKEICKDLRIEIDKKIIVLATGPFPLIKDREIFIESALEVIKNFENLQLIIKVHPSEEISFYKKLVGNKNKNVIVTKYDIFKTLFVCDILLHVHSAVGLEAAILGKPQILAHFIGNTESVDYTKKGIVIRVDNLKELKEGIKNILYNDKIKNKLNENLKNFVYNHCYKTDGKSSERIVNLINKMKK